MSAPTSKTPGRSPMPSLTRTKRGGTRPGGGRPVGSTKYGEPTKVIRIPESAEAKVLDFLDAHYRRHGAAGSSPGSSSVNAPRSVPDMSSKLPPEAMLAVIDPPEFGLPLYAHAVPAGLPAPADDYVEKRLDLNAFLIRNPVATFYFRVSGDSMTEAGIQEGMIAAVDCSILPRHRDVVLAAVDGDFTVKRYVKVKGGFELHPDSQNPIHKPILCEPGRTIEVRGVVIGTIQKFS